MRSFAQGPFIVQGSVQDSTGAALPKATVLLAVAKDTFTALSNEKGQFSFSLLQAKSFELQVTMKGYLPYQKKINPGTKNTALQLKPIILLIDYRDLEPVIVSRVKPMTVGEDTVTYHAAAFPVREGAEVEAILKRLPGVEVDMDGNVIVQGKKISQVMVDGKLFFGGDVLKAIRNLPAEIVDKLQVIDDYGDQARLTGVKSGDANKVLNIVLKKDKRTGTFGQAEAGLGNENKYISNIFANSFNGERQLSANGSLNDNNPSGKDPQTNIGASYADRWASKWKIETNAGYNSDRPHTGSSMDQLNTYTGGQTHLIQSSQNEGDNHGGNAGGTLTYTPDAYHTLRIRPNGNIQRSQQTASTDFLTTQQDSGINKISKGTTSNSSLGRSSSMGSQLYYEQLSPHSKRRLSLDANLQYANNQQNADTRVNNNVSLNNQNTYSTQHYLVNTTNPNWNLDANLNYYSPLGKKGFLQLGYALHQNNSHNTKTTFNQDSLHPSPILVDSLSQDYTYLTFSQRFHIGYVARFQKFNLSAILNAQPGLIKGNTDAKGKDVQYSYLNWLPSLQTNYQINKFKSLSVQYHGSQQLPSLQQLQPVTDLTNPQYPIIGNPSLRPAYTHNISLNYNVSQLKATQYMGYGVNLGYSNTQNTILPDIIHPKDSSGVIQKTEFVNAGGIHSINASYYLNLPAIIHKRLRINLNGSLMNGHTITIADNISAATVTTTYSQSIHFQWLIPDIFESDLSGNYSLTSTHYSANSAPSTSIPSIGWNLNNRQYFWHQLILSYQFSQFFNGVSGHGLQSNPASLTASLQYQFLKKNKATFSLTGYNLLSGASATGLSITPNSVTKTQTDLIGRYFIASFILKLSRFGE